MFVSARRRRCTLLCFAFDVILLFTAFHSNNNRCHGWTASTSSSTKLLIRPKPSSSLGMVAEYQKTTLINGEKQKVANTDEFSISANGDDNDEMSRDVQESLSSNSSSQQEPPLVSVLFNVNARGVSSSMIDALQRKCSDSRMKIYATTSPEEGLEALHEILQTKPRILIPVGGDGTLCTLIQNLYEQQQQGEENELPLLGYLPMGTGNAVGSVVGCRLPKRRRRIFSSTSRQVVNTIQELLTIAEQMEGDTQKGQQLFDIVELPLLKITTTNSDESTTKEDSYITFFAGLGFDSLMLQDYQNLQDFMKQNSFWSRYRKTFSSVLGYCVALVTRTLPQCLERNAHQVQVEISTNSTSAKNLWIDHRRGDVARSLSSDGVLYRGTTGIVAASTVPYYGGGLRLFPFASLYPNQFQLRLGRIHPMKGMRNLPGIFAGTYRDTSEDEFGCLDYVLDQCSIRILSSNGTYPVQQAGESVGACTKVDMEVLSNTKARFVTLLPSRLIEDELE